MHAIKAEGRSVATEAATSVASLVGLSAGALTRILGVLILLPGVGFGVYTLSCERPGAGRRAHPTRGV